MIKHGCSLAVVIPAAVCRELGIKRGYMVRLRVLGKWDFDDLVEVFYLEIEPVFDIDTGVEKKIHA